MTKLSRKLLLSIVTVALALVTLGATTFAWFTLSTRAEVQEFEVDVTSGAGIEISADGESYSNFIKAEDIYDAINRANSSRVLDHVTSPDGITFKTIGFDEDGKVHFNNSTTSGWTEFKLWFRSPENGVKVYMLNNTTVTSTGIKWMADAEFKLKSTDTSLTEVGKTYTLYGANAVRISTTENKVTPPTSDPGSDFSYDDGENAIVFELGYKDDQELGTSIKTEYGSVAYYNTKNQNNQITIDPENPPKLPETVYGYNNLPELKNLNTSAITDTHIPVDTLTVASNISGTTLYYGQITVRIWLEGWDPDMFNAIMADKIQIHLFFGGHSPSSSS